MGDRDRSMTAESASAMAAAASFIAPPATAAISHAHKRKRALSAAAMKAGIEEKQIEAMLAHTDDDAIFHSDDDGEDETRIQELSNKFTLMNNELRLHATQISALSAAIARNIIQLNAKGRWKYHELHSKDADVHRCMKTKLGGAFVALESSPGEFKLYVRLADMIDLKSKIEAVKAVLKDNNNFGERWTLAGHDTVSKSFLRQPGSVIYSSTAAVYKYISTNGAPFPKVTTRYTQHERFPYCISLDIGGKVFATSTYKEMGGQIEVRLLRSFDIAGTTVEAMDVITEIRKRWRHPLAMVPFLVDANTELPRVQDFKAS
eukprot:TRINITY_DN33910_c0_g1_i1.p1 TRINITY_DN33910_c0_g1~~TRINITY_DN33910_c0_g1_i1.p1  ORF type:complete len:319 (+),score=36.37 TRINITY_DN33910_c0_g1_i1:148-1104(+)